MKTMTSFNVLIVDNGKVKHYDVLPYFRNSWKDKYNKEEKNKIKAAKHEAKRKQLFKDWIISCSKYMFWARCEWEMLIANWPFGSYRMKEKMKTFLKNPINLDDYVQCLNFENIIIADMHKIDVHEQIMMNINIIVDILYNELKLEKLDKKHEDSSNI